MLRMAETIYIPQQSAALEPILVACSSLYRWYERMAIAATHLLYKPIYKITFGFIPMVVTWLILFLGSSIISFGISSLWWIHFIAIRWRLLSWEGRSLRDIFHNPNPIKPDQIRNKSTSSTTVRRAFLDVCSMALQANYDAWRQQTIAMNKKIISIQDWGKDTFA